MHVQASENWLAVCGESSDFTIVVTGIGALTASEAQAALNAQYGKGEFSASDHGTVIVIHSRPALRARMANRDTDDLRALLPRMTEGNMHAQVIEEELRARQPQGDRHVG
jgi:hypothetical protein